MKNTPPMTDARVIHHTLQETESILKTIDSELDPRVVFALTFLQSDFVLATMMVGCRAVEGASLQMPSENVMAVNSYPDLLFEINSSV